jgi:predicted DNA-binding transcriptional regulator AlpA
MVPSTTRRRIDNTMAPKQSPSKRTDVKASATPPDTRKRKAQQRAAAAAARACRTAHAVAWASDEIYAWMQENRIPVPEDRPFEIMRLTRVKTLVPFSTSSIYRMMANGRFPRTIALPNASALTDPRASRRAGAPNMTPK